MRFFFQTVFVCFVLILVHLPNTSIGQKGVQFDIKKPEELDTRVLRSEKSDQGKFGLTKRFFQNSFTHFNYFFNANTKLNEIIASAKAQHKDDFSELLPFYNYSLDETMKDKEQLDSVIYKSTTGIVLHDLRNDWVDNLYLLWGISYYLQKEFDSAYYTFQFINYAFAEKEKDGYYKYIGSRMDGNNALSIATKEKTSLPKRIFSEPPSRNDAFIWMIRANLEREAFAEAAGLIETLRKDPVFPKRLKNDLYEVQALWFYKNNIWDSSAHYLSKALGNADTKNEQARWEYLIGQLNEKAGNYKESEKYFQRSVGHTTDLVMEIYARLNIIRVNKGDGQNNIDKNIASLMSMAKKDKYKDYRDIVYYMAAQMEMERNNLDAAMNMLKKSIKYDNGDLAGRNKAFLQLAEFAYSKKQYRTAYNFYDSLNLSDQNLKNPQKINDRKELLGKIAFNIEVTERQDSLFRVAALPEEERKDFIKKLVRQLRKQSGLGEEDNKSLADFNTPVTNTPDLFSNNTSKGEWYFYNTTLRTKGAVDFKARWGNRPNVDNWRRARVISNQNTKQPDITSTDPTKTAATAESAEISYESLLNRLPLTAEKIAVVEDSLKNALFDLGSLYLNGVEDCEAMITTYERLHSQFSDFDQMDKVLFNLYFCYTKTGRNAESAKIKNEMLGKHAGSNLTAIVSTGKNPEISGPEKQATQLYESIYQLFIEGKFDEAISKKKQADEKYKKSFWTPQLLYIEAVYYIQQRQDEKATASLNEIIATHTGTPIAVKASNLIDVLSRRNEIEEELRNLSISRPKPVPAAPVIPDTVKISKPSNVQPIVTKPEINQPTDSLTQKKAQPVTVTAFKNEPQSAHSVIIVLNKVDPVFQNEARNAYFRFNREKFSASSLQASLSELDKENRLLVITSFKDDQEALNYANVAKSLAATEITPWLNKDKYEFLIISEKNLEILKASPDLSVYKNFLRQLYPGKF